MQHTNIFLIVGWLLIAICFFLAKSIQQKKSPQNPEQKRITPTNYDYHTSVARFKARHGRLTESETRPLAEKSNLSAS